MQTFQDFLAHDEEVIRNMSTLLIEAKGAFERGEMSHSEFTEIAHDITEIKTIDDILDDVDRRRAAHEAFNVLVRLVENITLVVK